MAKKKKRSYKKKKRTGFGALTVAASRPAAQMSKTELLGVAGTVVAGVVLSNVVGNNLISVLGGASIAAYGAYKKNVYLIAGGTSLAFSVAASSAAKTLSEPPADEINGLSFKNFSAGAKSRMGSFITSFKDKFKIPKTATPSAQTTEGLGAVYQNPFKQLKQPDFTELDRVQAQIENMNGLFGDDFPTREF